MPTPAESKEEQPVTTRATSELESPGKHITDESAEDSEADTSAGTTSAPGVVRQVMPKVIPQAQRSIHGRVRVKLKVNVDASGNVVQSTFISRGPSGYFAKVAEDAARRWKFAPSSAEARAWNLEFDFKRSGTQVRSAEAR